jgi:two-component system sensor histidine kinase ChvG|tara:strand:- start:413 stop:1948 length:1536 start_codon:yes stop_codon:yes gene_type:complete
MLSNFIKNLSILKKFLFLNLVFFLVIGVFTLLYLRSIEPSLIKNKASNHIQIIDNTTDHLKRLKINFNIDEIKKFLFSTRFLFQNLDRVVIFDSNFNLIGDTDTLDLDPRSFSPKLEIVEMDILDSEVKKTDSNKQTSLESKNLPFLKDKLTNYANSSEFGKPLAFTQNTYEQFILTTIKNVNIDENNYGFIVIQENANEIRVAINERKNFILRTAAIVIVVIMIFSFVLNRYFLKPIKNIVNYTNIIKEKSNEETNIENIKKRNDELGILSKSVDEMTKELNKRITNAENFSTDLVHEIRNPLASLKSASEIISETENKTLRDKLINIISHDVERIERLVTDYSQMLKDEAAISSEQMKELDLKLITRSVVDDYNGVYNSKRGISVKLNTNGSKDYKILGIENRVEQIIANLLDNSISFSNDNQEIEVELEKANNGSINLNVIDQGEGFKETDTNKIFNRFYSNRPEKFGEHSGLGLNIVKNLVELHNGQIRASNNDDKGAKIEITFPKI